MKTIDDGGPAFPEVRDIGDRAPYLITQGGMTLRDWFAGQVLAGMCANLHNMKETTNENRGVLCYAQADAMIAARENPTP